MQPQNPALVHYYRLADLGKFFGTFGLKQGFLFFDAGSPFFSIQVGGLESTSWNPIPQLAYLLGQVMQVKGAKASIEQAGIPGSTVALVVRGGWVHWRAWGVGGCIGARGTGGGGIMWFCRTR